MPGLVIPAGVAGKAAGAAGLDGLSVAGAGEVRGSTVGAVGAVVGSASFVTVAPDAATCGVPCRFAVGGVAGTAGVGAWLGRRSVGVDGNVLASTVGSVASFGGSGSLVEVG
ncbi:MAG: hypothetical protein AB7O66_10765 [Limisphaerales bacterium]